MTGVGEQQAARIRSIDGLRALALLAVFAFHTWEFAGSPQIPIVSTVVGANIRPDFFVVLTGFVLFLPLARDWSRLDTFSTGTYLRRRLRRIVPPYYAALAYPLLLPVVLAAVFRALGREANWPSLPSFGDLLAHLTFTHMFFIDYWSSINGSLWTMSLEMQLYLLFPIVVALIARFGTRALVAAAALSVTFSTIAVLVVDGPNFPNHFLWTASGLGRLVELAGGMAAAWLIYRVPHRAATVWARVAAASTLAVAGLVVGTSVSAPPLPLREASLAVGFAALICLTMWSRTLGRVFAWRPLTWLGYHAYSIFLIHQPTAWYLREFLTKLLGIPEGTGLLILLWTLGLAITVFVGYLFFRLFEAPAIRWSHAARPSTQPLRTEVVAEAS